MANIFQKIFLPKTQWIVLDFIKAHPDSVQYEKSEKRDRFNDVIGTTHRVTINAEDKTLSAELTKFKYSYPLRDSQVEYSFVCTKPCNKDNCSWHGNGVRSQNDSFATRVYTNMLNNYVAKNGCPCER